MTIMLIFVALAIGILIIRSNYTTINNLNFTPKIDTMSDELKRDCSTKAGLSY